MTLPVIRLLQEADGIASELVGEVVRQRSVTPEHWGEILRSLGEHRAIEYARARASEYAALAKEQLKAFPPCLERDALMALPDYLLARDR